MINFFRKIRQRLLTENKFSKYLIYAIGEIALVMIGILLALQVNAWNEERKNRITENEVIASLNNEFKTAKLEILGLKKLIESKDENLITLSNNCSLKKPSISPERMDSLIARSFSLPSFNPPDATINDILNSGKFDVIRNVELRKLISEWNGNLEEAKRQEVFQGEFLYNRFAPFIEDRIEFQYRGRGNAKYQNGKYGRFGIDSRELLKDVRFYNLVRREVYFNYFVLMHYKNLETDIDEIIELTQKKRLTDLIDKENGVDRIIDIVKKGDVEDQGYYISEKVVNDLGYTFIRQGRNNEALKLLKLNTEIYPDASNTYDSYGEILLKIGDEENAIKAYEKSLKLNPNNENAKKVLSEIK